MIRMTVAALVAALLAPATAVARGSGSVAPVPRWEAVAKTVRERLAADPELAPYDMQVRATGLLLTVSGTVEHRKERRRAMTIARTAAPDMMVEDDVRVAPPPPAQAQAADQAFASRYMISRGGTQIRPAARPAPSVPARPAPRR
jgi:hypothetical protein